MDMVVRLLGQNGQFDTAMGNSRTATWRLNQSLDNLVQSMERQLAAETASARQTEIMALVDKGASSAKLEYALSLANQLDQQEALLALEQSEIAAADKKAASIRRVLEGLERQANETGHTADLTAIYKLEMLGASQAELEWAESLLESVAAMQANAAAQKTVAADEAKAEAAERSRLGTIQSVMDGLKKKAFEEAHGAEATVLYTLKANGASEAELQLAQRLMESAAASRQAAAEQSAAQKTVAADEAKAEAAERSRLGTIQSVMDGLKKKAFEEAHGAAATVLYTLKANGASEAELKLAQRLMESAAASRQAAADKVAAQRQIDAEEQRAIQLKAENEAWTRKVITTEHERNWLLGVSTAYLKMKELAERGATEAEIEEYYAAYRLNQALDQQTAAYNRNVAATRQATSAQSAHTGAANRGLFAVQALALGVQDAAQVYGTMGLAGALSASANNLVFMTSLMNPQLAIVTALTVATGQFAAVLVPLAMGWRDTSKDGERLNETLQKQLDLTLELSRANREFEQRIADVTDRSSGKSVQNETRRAGFGIAGDIADQERALSDLLRRREQLSEMASWGTLTPKARDAGQAEIDKEIAKTQDKLRALDQKKAANDRDQVKADQAAAYGEQQTRIAESHEANRRYQEENRKREQSLIDDKIKAEAKAWNDFYATRKKMEADWVKEKAELEKSIGMESAQKIADYRAAQQLKIDRDLKSELGRAEESRTNVALFQQDLDVESDPKRRQYLAQRIAEQNRAASNKESAAIAKAAFRTSQLDTDVSGLGKDAEEAARQKEAADKAAMGEYEDSVKGRRKNLNALTDDARGKSRSAVDARSADGFAKLFDALGGSSNPQRDVAKNTAAIFGAMERQLKLEEDQLEAVKALKPVKSKK